MNVFPVACQLFAMEPEDAGGRATEATASSHRAGTGRRGTSTRRPDARSRSPFAERQEGVALRQEISEVRQLAELAAEPRVLLEEINLDKLLAYWPADRVRPIDRLLVLLPSA